VCTRFIATPKLKLQKKTEIHEKPGQGHSEIAEELSTQTEVEVTSVRANQVRKDHIPAGILRVNRRTFRQATE